MMLVCFLMPYAIQFIDVVCNVICKVWITNVVLTNFKNFFFSADFTLMLHSIRHQRRKTTVLSCHRCLIYTGVEKMNNI